MCKGGRVKLAYVTPRYGTEVVGGAEYAARMLAERVVAQLGWEVEALTSCALDASTWENHYPVGSTEINGVTVKRFVTSEPRHKEFPHTSFLVHNNAKLAPLALQEKWVDQQGPTAPDLIEAIGDSDADVVVFYPYLYYPTVRGLPKVKTKSVMHPAAHDEASIRMTLFAEVFGQADGFVFQTDGERRMVENLFPVAQKPQLLLGLGVDPMEGDTRGFRETYRVGDAPFIFCLGRVDDGKGATLLAEYFSRYKERHPGPLKLVFSGPVHKELEPHPDIIVTGMITDEHKWGALRDCEVLVSPSAFEAFSLALIEGWSADRPVIVNRACLATAEHVERSQGGLWFRGYGDFEASLHRLLTDDALAKEMAAAGKAYVDARFRWPALIERYGQFLTTIAQH